MTPRATVLATLVALLALTGCSPRAGSSEPLEAGCRLVDAHDARRVDREDSGTLRAFAQRLGAEADALSSSDAAELRPLVRAAAAAAREPDDFAAYSDYRRVLRATAGVCAATTGAGDA